MKTRTAIGTIFLAAAVSAGAYTVTQSMAKPAGAYFDTMLVKDDVGQVMSQLYVYVDSDPNIDTETRADRIAQMDYFWEVYLNDGLGGQIHRRDWRKYGFPLWDLHDAYVLQDDSLRPDQIAVYLDRSNALRNYDQ